MGAVFEAIKIKDSSNLLLSQKSLLLKIIVKVLSSPLARKKSFAYYEVIDNLINSCFQKIEIEGLKDKDMLIKNKKKYDEDLPMYRLEVVLV